MKDHGKYIEVQDNLAFPKCVDEPPEDVNLAVEEYSR